MPPQMQKFGSNVSGIFLVLRTGLMLVSTLGAHEHLAQVAHFGVLIAEVP